MTDLTSHGDLNRAAMMATITDEWSSYWTYPATAGEMAALQNATKDWPSLAPLIQAMTEAKSALSERPSVKWLVDAANRRRQPSVKPVRRGCPDCKGGQWIDDAPAGDPPMLRHCPECNPLGDLLQQAGVYAIDAPPLSSKGGGNPKAQAIIDQFRSGPAPVSGREVMLVADEPMTDSRREYWIQRCQAEYVLGRARRERFEYLERLARVWRVELPPMPVGDQGAVDLAVRVLVDLGADVDMAVVTIPTVDDYLAGVPCPGVSSPWAADRTDVASRFVDSLRRVR
jgi:hypothetical protein